MFKQNGMLLYLKKIYNELIIIVVSVTSKTDHAFLLFVTVAINEPS
jgi:hypothetical protein